MRIEAARKNSKSEPQRLFGGNSFWRIYQNPSNFLFVYWLRAKAA
jgi:hypothetical protein